jgi:hypothetical protein
MASTACVTSLRTLSWASRAPLSERSPRRRAGGDHRGVGAARGPRCGSLLDRCELITCGDSTGVHRWHGRAMQITQVAAVLMNPGVGDSRTRPTKTREPAQLRDALARPDQRATPDCPTAIAPRRSLEPVVGRGLLASVRKAPTLASAHGLPHLDKVACAALDGEVLLDPGLTARSAPKDPCRCRLPFPRNRRETQGFSELRGICR